MSTVFYFSDAVPHLQLRLQDTPEILVKFVDKSLKLERDNESDAVKIALLDGFIQTKPNIAQLIRKVDVSQAEELARKHMAQRAAENRVAKGGLTGAHIGSDNLEIEQDSARAKLLAAGVPAENVDALIAELEKDNQMMIAVRQEPMVGPDPSKDKILQPVSREGFTSDAELKAKALAGKTAAPSGNVEDIKLPAGKNEIDPAVEEQRNPGSTRLSLGGKKD